MGSMLPLPIQVGSGYRLTLRRLRLPGRLHALFRAGSSGDHVGESGRKLQLPEGRSARSARRLAPTASRAAGPGGSPACSRGLTRSAAKSRAVSRESKLKEHGDV